MNKKDAITIATSIIALVFSAVSLYYSNFKFANIDFIVGKNGQVWQNRSNKSISLFLPVTFTNNSNAVGYVYDSKVVFYPVDTRISDEFHWYQFWRTVPERDTLNNVSLINRPISDADIIPFIGKSKAHKLINFWINSNKIVLGKGKYIVELYISVNPNDTWEKKVYEFEYTGQISIEINRISE